MFKSQKNVFWQALLFAILVFFIGLFVGYSIENSRTKAIEKLYMQSEFYLLDAKIQTEIYSFSEIDCEDAFKGNIDFSSRIYNEFVILDKYESANQITDEIILEHKKYDLLRALFWISAIKIKERCNLSYHNVVYLYDYNKPRLDIKAKQSVFSRILHEVQIDKGDSVMLIPLAGDNNIASVSYLMRLYNISEEELPVILIDENVKIKEVESVQDMEKYLN